MNGITVPMAVVDFIPVALFFASAVLLQRDLYSKMVKGAFALLATGSTMVLIGGIFKAGWKILYALGICDYTLLDASFSPCRDPAFCWCSWLWWGCLPATTAGMCCTAWRWCRCIPAPFPL